MEKILQSKLSPEETVLWTGRPEAFETLDKTHKSPFMKKCILIAIVAVAIIAWYVNFAIQKGHSVDVIVIAIVLLVAAYGVCADLLEAKKLKNRTLYALTDMRMIAVVGGNFEAEPYANVDSYEFVEDEDGHVSLICGEWPKEESSRLRRTATVRGACNDANTSRCTSFAMYALEDVESVKKIMAKYMAV